MGPTRPKRARRTQSCTECRRRKKLCRGGVPDCEGCLKRGIGHLCRYGDDRDFSLVNKGGDGDYSRRGEGEEGVERLQGPTFALEEATVFANQSREGIDTAYLDMGNSPGEVIDETASTSVADAQDLIEARSGRVQTQSSVRSPTIVGGQIRQQNGNPYLVTADESRDSGDESDATSCPDTGGRWRQKLAAVKHILPDRWQAERLIDLHRKYLSFSGLLMMDDHDLSYSVYMPNEAERPGRTQTSFQQMRIREAEASAVVLILVICSSSLSILPRSIIRPILEDASGASNDIEHSIEDRIAIWAHLIVDFFDSCDLFARPTIEAVAALLLYGYNFVGLGDQTRVISRLDLAIRLARTLGLDRLGSAEQDQTKWDTINIRRGSSELDSSVIEGHGRVDPTSPLMASIPMNSSGAGAWASRTFALQDHRRRECGRSIWSMLVLRDWNAGPQAGGTCGIHPESFDTAWPSVSLVYSASVSQSISRQMDGRTHSPALVEQVEPWHYITGTAECFRIFIELTSRAMACNREIEYEEILRLDHRLQLLLDERPRWIRPETGASRWRFTFGAVDEDGILVEDVRVVAKYVPHHRSSIASCCSLMNLISSNLWHKSSIIHRPFLARSLTNPGRYGMSCRRTVGGALSLIESCDRHLDEANATVLVFRVQHAAISLISFLLLHNIINPGGSGESSGRTPLHTRVPSGDSNSVHEVPFDSLRIHKSLLFAIKLLKDTEQRTRAAQMCMKTLSAKVSNTEGINRSRRNHGRSVFDGVSDALDKLLVAAARMEQQQTSSEQMETRFSRFTNPRFSAAFSSMPMGSEQGARPEDLHPSSSVFNNAEAFSSNDLNGSFESLHPRVDATQFNRSILQLDKDLSSLSGGNGHVYAMAAAAEKNVGIGGGTSGTASNDINTTNRLVVPPEPSVPDRPPWISQNLWQDIFTILEAHDPVPSARPVPI